MVSLQVYDFITGVHLEVLQKDLKVVYEKYFYWDLTAAFI